MKEMMREVLEELLSDFVRGEKLTYKPRTVAFFQLGETLPEDAKFLSMGKGTDLDGQPTECFFYEIND